MVAIQTSIVSPPQPAPVPQPADAPNASGGAGEPAATPVDTVSLSADARQALATAPPSIPGQPGNAEVAAAIAALNDASGKTSLSDQLQAYTLVETVVAKGGAATAPGGAGLDGATALMTSSFARHADQVFDSIHSMIGATNNWSDLANSRDRSLAAFNALSSSDQQTYVAALGVYTQIDGGVAALAPSVAPIATVADYQANQQAQSDVERAVQAAITSPTYAATVAHNVSGGVNDWAGKRDDLATLTQSNGDTQTAALMQLSKTATDSTAWTQAAQAYFAQYGPAPAPIPDSAGAAIPQMLRAGLPAGYQPPDVATVVTALGAINDTSGKTSEADQLAAYDTVGNYLSAGQLTGVTQLAVALNQGDSPTLLHASHVDDIMSNGLSPNSNVPQVQLDRLNSLSPDDQLAYWSLNSKDFDGTVRLASVDSLKANLTARSSVTDLYKRATAAFGVDDLADITGPAANNPAIKTLRALMSTDQMNDGWTAQAQSFLAGLKPGDLNPLDGAAAASAPSAKDVASAKALATLKTVAANQRAWVAAQKAEREGKPAPKAQAPAAAGDNDAAPDIATQIALQMGEQLDTRV
jgi:hypothetical protein